MSIEIGSKTWIPSSNLSSMTLQKVAQIIRLQSILSSTQVTRKRSVLCGASSSPRTHTHRGSQIIFTMVCTQACPSVCSGRCTGGTGHVMQMFRVLDMSARTQCRRPLQGIGETKKAMNHHHHHEDDEEMC